VATKWGKANSVNLLLDNGAKIDVKTRDGLTPLHCAARSGHDQVVELLISRNASINAKTKNGLTALHMAAQGDHVEAARILFYHSPKLVDQTTCDFLTPIVVTLKSPNCCSTTRQTLMQAAIEDFPKVINASPLRVLFCRLLSSLR
jgi:hypothetical protein